MFPSLARAAGAGAGDTDTFVSENASRPREIPKIRSVFECSQIGSVQFCFCSVRFDFLAFSKISTFLSVFVETILHFVPFSTTVVAP